MSIRHPDPCGSNGETADALNAADLALLTAHNEAERILAGAFYGACSVHQALRATDLRQRALAIAGIYGAVEAATQHAMARAVSQIGEAA